jgi:hypothetical protein
MGIACTDRGRHCEVEVIHSGVIVEMRKAIKILDCLSQV